MGRFLITGLPRSRTAWFAVATEALHEPISREGWLPFMPKWKPNQGVSDGGAGMFLRDILATYSPRTLIIDRPLIEAARSFYAYAAPHVPLDGDRLITSLARLQDALAHVSDPQVKRVPYHALNDIDVLHECFDWLGVNPRNLEQLMHMNIQSSMQWNLARFHERVA